VATILGKTAGLRWSLPPRQRTFLADDRGPLVRKLFLSGQSIGAPD
jgi:hypothetical protein